MILDYCDFAMGSAFSATGQLPKRGALPTSNWRGCARRAQGNRPSNGEKAVLLTAARPDFPMVLGLRGGSRFSMRTLVGTLRNARDAPKGAIRRAVGNRPNPALIISRPSVRLFSTLFV
jgi:hypothetical protein